MASSANDPWSVSDAEFPTNGTLVDQLRFLVRYAILAPSRHNTQPWRFHVFPDGVDVLADHSRALTVVDPDDRELFISCGAAAFTLRTALRHAGYEVGIYPFPDSAQPDCVARIVVRGLAAPDPVEERL